jgi:DNA-binding CsgD family transcriptional regulator
VERLGKADLRAALDFLAVVGAASTLDQFADLLIVELPRLIRSDIVSYNEVDPQRRRAYFHSNPVETMFQGSEQILERYMDQNPLVVHYASTGDGAARKWSDFITQRELHSTDLYNELFRPLRVEREMVATLPSRPPVLVGIVVMRNGRDFDERDRTILDLLRPHLANAYANAVARETVAALEQALPGDNVVILGPHRRIRYASSYAVELLSCFGESPPFVLPLALERLATTVVPMPGGELRAMRNGRRVIARFASASVLFLREEGASISSERLLRLGLSRREAEVLVLVAAGNSNAAIGTQLEITERTVKKHLEAIYEKLGVRSRTQASAVAFEAAS